MWRTKDRRMCTGLYRLCVCVCALWKQLRSQRNGSFVPRLRAKGVLCTGITGQVKQPRGSVCHCK